MSRSYNEQHYGYYGLKGAVKYEHARGMRSANRRLIGLIKKGTDPDGISFPTRKQNVSNWWNWD